tara:strand:+ start:444 stop:1310 length:867 start_codon:yes stop_codon:yes gene_type:complete
MSDAYFENFKFSDEELETRKKCINGSETNIIASGNAEAINKLFLEKTGSVESEDLTHVFPVMLGNITEELNIEWISRKYGYNITNRQQVFKSKRNPFMRCTPDGVITNFDNDYAVVDAKYTMGRPQADETWSDVIPRLLKFYTPQINWNAYILSEHLDKPVNRGVLSIIRAGNEPIIEEVAIDENYQAELIRIATYFHSCVQLNIAPDEIITDEPPVPPEDRKPYDMEGNEDWKRCADNYIQTKGAAISNKEYENKLKALVPKDAKHCFGHGINIKVAKNNRKTIELL